MMKDGVLGQSVANTKVMCFSLNVDKSLGSGNPSNVHRYHNGLGL